MNEYYRPVVNTADECFSDRSDVRLYTRQCIQRVRHDLVISNSEQTVSIAAGLMRECFLTEPIIVQSSILFVWGSSLFSCIKELGDSLLQC